MKEPVDRSIYRDYRPLNRSKDRKMDREFLLLGFDALWIFLNLASRRDRWSKTIYRYFLLALKGMNRHKLEVIIFVIIFFFSRYSIYGIFSNFENYWIFQFFFVLNILKIDLGRQNISSLN